MHMVQQVSLRYLPKKIKNIYLQKDLYGNIYNSLIHNT